MRMNENKQVNDDVTSSINVTFTWFDADIFCVSINMCVYVEPKISNDQKEEKMGNDVTWLYSSLPLLLIIVFFKRHITSDMLLPSYFRTFSW